MIRVTIEVVPHGEETKKRTVQMLEIGNVQPVEELGDALHDYEARMSTGEVVEFAHVVKDGIEACVWQALNALVMQRAREARG